MTNYEIYTRLREISKLTEDFLVKEAEFIEPLKTIRAYELRAIKFVYSEQGKLETADINKSKSLISQFWQTTNIHSNMILINEWKTSIVSILSDISDDRISAVVNEFIEEFDNILKNLFKGVQDRQNSSLYYLIHIIDDAFSKAKMFIKLINALSGQYTITEEDIPDGMAELVIILDTIGEDINDYISYTQSVADIYQKLLELTGLSLNENSLRVVKIESGSWFEKLFGEENLVKCVVDIISKCTDLAFKKFTYEGKIARAKDMQELLLSQLDLMTKIKKINPDAICGDEEIEIAIAVLSKSMFKMTKSISGIKVNGMEYKLNDEQTKKFIEGRKNLLIENSRDVSDE